MLRRILYTFLILLYLQIQIHGKTLIVDFSDVDRSIRPVDDFFTFINGHWINRTQIPSSETQWGSMYTLHSETRLRLKTILDDLTQNATSISPHPMGSPRRQLGELYLAGLDEQAIEIAGLQPLKQTLIQLNQIETYQELINFTLKWYKQSNQESIFRFEVIPDNKNSSINMAHWIHSGIVLPDRSFYFRNDPITKKIRSEYIQYINRLLNLSNSILNITTDIIDAEDILSLETQLATSHLTRVELRNDVKNYNKFTVIELHRMMPNLNWNSLLITLGIERQTILMPHSDYYRLLDKLIANQPLSIWKNKIRFTILHDMSKYLSKEFVDTRFAFYNRILRGQEENKARWMRIIEDINEYIGELLGKLYIEQYFSPEAKQRTINLTKHLINAYYQRLVRNPWMTNTTKQTALKKLENMDIQIGYPSKWKSYEDIHFDRRSYFQSMLSAFQHAFQEKLRNLAKSVNKNDWVIPPQTVNAAYHQINNQVIFPAGILQEPFFYSHADDAVNYGAIGSCIAHELTHGFDDQRSHYDQNGNLRLWWTEEDMHRFNSRKQLLIKQFNSYQILNTNINGYLTLGENIADLGGIEIAYEAFLETEQAKQGETIDGLTPQERFFYGFTRSHRMKFLDKTLLIMLQTDEHSPPLYRANGILSNMNAFYETFNVTRYDRMYREPSERAVIW